jgi:acyl-CoA thioesterase
MPTKKELEEQTKKAKMLALAESGAEHYKKMHSDPAPAPENPPAQRMVPPSAPKVVAPPVRKSKPESLTTIQGEEPTLGPEPEDPATYLVKRRRSLRDDPEWIGTTLYLRRNTHAALQDACRGAGLDMSRLVQFCVSLQMDEKQRSPVLSQLLGE